MCTERVKGASKRRRKALEQAARRVAEAEEAARELDELRANSGVAVLDSWRPSAEPTAPPRAAKRKATGMLSAHLPPEVSILDTAVVLCIPQT
jgi:hypothetical protein